MRRTSLLTLAVAVSLIPGGLVATSSPVDAVPAWSIVPSPNPTALPDATLSGVSCPTATNCTAVGFAHSADFTSDVTLIGRWNGKAWTIVPSDPTVQAQLSAVSCPTATNCTAVGTNGSTFIERWDGKTWTIVPSPTPSTSQLAGLSGVSCPTATSCTAVGFSGNAALTTAKTLIERWNGKTWTIVPSPTPSTFQLASLSGVSCPTATSCTAVGYAQNNKPGTAIKSLIERWNGKTWTNVPSPNPTLQAAAFFAVSCPTATNCTAVGTNGSTFIERWNGKTWTIVPSPTPSTSQLAGLSGVSCPTATSCAAVGFSGNAALTASKTLIERWNGKTWTIVPSPNPPALPIPQLLGVACPTAADCTAVGGDSGSTSAAPLVEQFG